MPSTRRGFVASLGAAVTGVAGCAAPRTGTGDGPPTDAAESVAAGEAVRVDGVRVTVADPVVAHAVRYLTAPDAVGVATAAGGQFVFVRPSVEGSGSPPAPAAFRLVADGTRYATGLPDVGPARVDAPVTGRRYGDDERGGYLAARVPAPLDATTVAVVLDGAARWTLPPATVDALRSPPPAFAATVDVPDRVAADEPIPVRVDVTNEGDGAGVFYGAINHQGPRYGAATFDVPVAAGGSTTYETRVDYHVGERSPPARVRFAVVGPDRSRSVAVDVAGGGTPDGGDPAAGTGTAAATR
jgi:hypothetical protein